MKDADVQIVRMVANDLGTGWLIGSVPHCAPPDLLSNSISPQLIMMSCCLWVMALDDTALGGWPLRGERGTNICRWALAETAIVDCHLSFADRGKKKFRFRLQ